MKRRSFVASSVTAALFAPLPAYARQGSTVDLESLLPTAADFGKGWKQFAVEVPTEVDNETFVEGVLTAYGGPEGQRCRVSILRHPDDRAAVNAAWETASFGIAFTTVSPDYATDYAGSDIDQAAPPNGTADAARYHGTLAPYGFAFAIGAYAIEPDLVVIVLTEGDELGFTGSGVTDADNVAEAIAAKV